MNKQIFVNLSVKDLKRSMDFFSKLGYTFNPQFTDDKAACMVISNEIYAMLLIEDFFKSFTFKDIVDTKKAAECTVALSCESKAEVDSLVEKAVKAGGVSSQPVSDMGFMYSRSFQDLDGHIWEILWMDPGYVQ
jgi:uncharacterized protein